jgi:hypothetical protein
MKRKDWMLIAVVGFFAAIFSIVISNSLFGPPKKHPVKVPVVDKISSDFPNPQTDPAFKSIFNSQAIDPTQLIQIGGGQNPAPFSNDNGQ